MRFRYLAFGLSAALAACGGGAVAPPMTSFAPASARVPMRSMSSGAYIKHVIIVIQENRSFDNLFGSFPGADGATHGQMYDGKTIKLHESNLYSPLAMPNSHQAFVYDYNGGKMNGFSQVYVDSELCHRCAYQYVNPSEIQPYWDMAKQYVLGDHMYPTESSGSFTGHQDLIRGDTEINDHESLIDFPSNGPWGCDAPPGTYVPLLLKKDGEVTNYGPFPCLTYPTLRDLLDAKKVSWKYYTPSLDGSLAGAYWDAFEAIKAVRYGTEWTTNISTPEKNIFKDIDAGSLASVSWIVPDGVNSDHSGFGKHDTGPSWVASIVNAIGHSPYWSSTAIVIVWDDWGGWYDHVPPPQLDYAGLGIRVPMIVVSPYAKVGYVSHTQYEFGSILKFIENNWDLGSLGTSDRRSTSIEDVFDFTQKPRKFIRIPAKYSKSFFEHQPSSNVPVDTD
jgi:phospholipase C